MEQSRALRRTKKNAGSMQYGLTAARVAMTCRVA